MDGVLFHIGTNGGTRQYVNPHTAGDVVASWSSIGEGTVDMFVQHTHNNQFGTRQVHVNSYTHNTPNSWMQVDLGENRALRPTHYCLRHGYENYHQHILRNWRLEGSNNGTHWTTIRNHNNDTSIPAQMAGAANWTVDNCTERFRWFRIYNHGLNSSRSNNLMCSGIELYGDLCETMTTEDRRLAEERR